MIFAVTMPKLSPTMEEGEIVAWHVQEGKYVEAGEVLIEVATDKATVEYQALDGGFLRKILSPKGTVVKVNEPIAVFSSTREESIEEYLSQLLAPKKEEKPLPQKEEKAASSEEEVLPKSSSPRFEPEFVPEPPLEDFCFSLEDTEEELKASPLAKRLAQEQGIDLSSIKGSGPRGRIMSRDLQTASKEELLVFKKGFPKDKPGSYEEEPLSPIRKVIAKRLQESKSFIPHFYLHQEVEVSKIAALREELKKFNISLTFNDFILRAVALCLQLHPRINSGFHSKHQSIVLFKTIDIAVAVAVEEGLLTPIIRYANYKNIRRLSQEMRRLAVRAKEGKLSSEEYKGGSFTISNLGMYGITQFEAIINPPQSAILSVGAIGEEPIVREGKIEIGKILRLTLSCDHRVIDGKQGAEFLRTLTHFLENPSLLLLES